MSWQNEETVIGWAWDPSIEKLLMPQHYQKIWQIKSRRSSFFFNEGPSNTEECSLVILGCRFAAHPSSKLNITVNWHSLPVHIFLINRYTLLLGCCDATESTSLDEEKATHASTPLIVVEVTAWEYWWMVYVMFALKNGVPVTDPVQGRYMRNAGKEKKNTGWRWQLKDWIMCVHVSSFLSLSLSLSLSFSACVYAYTREFCVLFVCHAQCHFLQAIKFW